MLMRTRDGHPILLSAVIALGVLVNCSPAKAAETATALLAGGCFWCVEADFEKLKGVQEVVSGFTGGSVANPSYKQVVQGGTGHYEAVQVEFDPAVISYDQILHAFLRSVDPTDAGGQFCDRGESYRTAIFVSGPAEKASAETAVREAEAKLGKNVVTPILERATFYPADAYHQDYYKQGDIILTRFGPRSKANAYKLYRESCGRDDRVRALWGSAAPFAGR